MIMMANKEMNYDTIGNRDYSVSRFFSILTNLSL